MADVDTSIPSQATGAAAKLAAQHSQENPLKLYGGWFCPFVQRSWIVLTEKRIAYQYIEINPYKKEPELLRLNPRGLVPTLAVPPADGAGADTEPRPLYDSTIVSEYLDEAYADETRYGPRLLPEDAYDRARCRLWIDHINTRVIPAFYKFIQHTPEKAFTIDEARSELLGHLETVTRQMDPRGPWFLGKDFSLVDIMLAPWALRLFLLDHYKPGGLQLPAPGQKRGESQGDDLWARWKVWYDAIRERPSVKETLSDAESYVAAYQRYAEDKTNSMVGQATRAGGKMP